MFNFQEYRHKPDRLTDLILWFQLVAPGVVLQKIGAFQKTFRYRGPDLDSATPYELKSITARLNNVLKRLNSGWAIYAESQRVRSEKYPESEFSDAIPLLIDEERRTFFSAGNHYENINYFTLVYLPPSENHDKFDKIMIKRDIEKDREESEFHLRNFSIEVERIYNLFKEIMPEAEELNDEETLTYLHSCISPKRHIVKVPETPIDLDYHLADTALVPGLEPRLGNHHIRTVSILGFPGTSIPGILNGLNYLNFEYRWVSRFIALDKNDAQKEIGNYRRQWFANRVGIKNMMISAITKRESAMVDNDAINKSNDADSALQEVSADYVSSGYFTMTVTVMDTDITIVEKKIRAVEKTINSMGFVVKNETVNAVEAWLGSLPGHCCSNVRRPLLNTLNLAHIFPLSAIWAGPEKNKHLKGPSLMYTQTSGNTPFRLDLHDGDVGHTLICGRTGAGKSVLLATIAAQFKRYPKSRLYFFDKGGSCRALTAGLGGDFYDLAAENDGALSFQPLAGIDGENERTWVSEWVYEILRYEGVTINPDVKKNIWTALCSLATSPRQERTITGLRLLIQDEALRQALQPYSHAIEPIETTDGSFARLFDADHDNLQDGDWQAFEMEQLMNTPAAVAPTLSYLFHRLEQRLDGSPTLFVLDECWLFLDNPVFAAKISEWLRVLRKANASVVFATQNLQDITNSPIAPAILEACSTKIFLPNANASDDRLSSVYSSFGLNNRERDILSSATPKRQYYYKSNAGSRLFELALGPVSLAYCGASSKGDQKMIKELLSNSIDKDSFNLAWLNFKKLPETAQIYEELQKLVGGNLNEKIS